MPVVPVEQNQVNLAQPGIGTSVQAPEMGGGEAMIGRATQGLGADLGDASKVKNEIDNQFDIAAAKEADRHLTELHTAAAYDPDNGMYYKRGRDALDASSGFEKTLNDNIQRLRSGLSNPRQQHYFDMLSLPKMLDWQQSAAEFVGQQKHIYAIDQANARADTSLKAATAAYISDPKQGEEQLATALGEYESAGRLQGWSDDQIKLQGQKAQTEALSTIAQQKAVSDPMAAVSFIESNKDRMDPGQVATLEESFRPRVQRQLGIQLADQISGAGLQSAGPQTNDPLAPLPNPHADPATVWTRIVGPGGHGGVESGTNADGSFRVSPKGAVGPAQVMPQTAREAAALADLPYDENRYKTDFAYNLALGKAYYQKQLHDFGDPILAAAAYNAGPGRVRSALAKGGDDWVSHLPEETQKYVAKVSGGAVGIGGSDNAKAVKYGLAEQLTALDNMGVAPEVKEAARSVLTQRAQEQSIIAQQDHAQWFNGFQLQLHDGTAGAADIKAARQSGKLTDYEEVSKAETILKERDKGQEDLVNFGKMMADPHFTFNVYDDTQRRAIDAGVKAMGGTPAAAFQVWQKTGLLAKTGAVALRGALVSTNPQSVQEAANIAGNMLHQNPNAFAGVDGQSDIERASIAFNHYVYDLGLSPSDAGQRVAQENDPKFKEQMKYTDPQRADTLKQLRQSGVNAEQWFSGAHFANDQQRAAANDAFHELIVDNLSHGSSNLGAATTQAVQQLRKVWGPDSRGMIVPYAPERIYPAMRDDKGNQSWAYVYRDAFDTVERETGHKPDNINLVPIPGVTDQDFRAGNPARYRILYSRTINGQQVVDAVPGEFAADTHVAARAQSETDHRRFGQERRHALDAQRLHQGIIDQPNAFMTATP